MARFCQDGKSSVFRQAGRGADEAQQHEGEAARANGAVHESALETAAGEVGWEQPKTRWWERVSFPSGEGVGRQRYFADLLEHHFTVDSISLLVIGRPSLR